MTAITFFAAGDPAPKGSKKVFMIGGKPITREVSNKLPAWDVAIREAACCAMVDRRPFVNKPLSVHYTFAFQRPRYHYGKTALNSRATLAPTRPPDVDKLARAVADSLTGIVFDDDSRIVRLCATKIWIRTGQVPGAFVQVAEVSEEFINAHELEYWEAAEEWRGSL